MQAQILQANFVGSSQSILTDRALSPDREPDNATDAVTGSATTVRSGATGTAGIAARSQINSRAATGNPVTATPGGSEDGEASGVPSLASGDAGAAAAKQLTGLPRATGTQAEGNATGAGCESAPHREWKSSRGSGQSTGSEQRNVSSTSLGVEGNSVFALSISGRDLGCGEVATWKAAGSHRRRLRRDWRIGTVPAMCHNRQCTQFWRSKLEQARRYRAWRASHSALRERQTQ